MLDEQVAAPDNTAVRVALWRALHVEVDSPPHEHGKSSTPTGLSRSLNQRVHRFDVDLPLHLK